VEDQPADSGNLTTDSAVGATPQQAADRRGHRLALTRKRVEDPVTEPEATAELVPAKGATGEHTDEPVGQESEEPDATGALASRRHWRRPWRRSMPGVSEAGATDYSVAEVPVEAAPERRVPTGKTRRTTKDLDVAAAQSRAEDKPPTELDAAPVVPDPQPNDWAHQDDSAQLMGDPEPDVEPEPEPVVLVPERPEGQHLLITAAVASMLFVAAGAFAGATLQPYLSDRAAVDTKLDIARTAADAITTLWSYTPDDMASLPDRSSQYLASEFATEYRRYIDAIIEPNRQAQVTNTTQVMGTAVESLGPSEATALVYTNSVSTSPVSKNIPSLRYLSYRLTMERHDVDWLVTSMNAMTKLDLTPQQ